MEVASGYYSNAEAAKILSRGLGRRDGKTKGRKVEAKQRSRVERRRDGRRSVGGEKKSERDTKRRKKKRVTEARKKKHRGRAESFIEEGRS